MSVRRATWVLGASIVLAASHLVGAVPLCQGVPKASRVVTDISDSGTRFIATGEATIMSETTEGLALAEDAARLDAKAALNDDRRVSKAQDGQMRGIHDLRACRNHDKLFVTVLWDVETARQAAEASAAMSRKQEPIAGSDALPKPGADRSVFDRLMH